VHGRFCPWALGAMVRSRLIWPKQQVPVNAAGFRLEATAAPGPAAASTPSLRVLRGFVVAAFWARLPVARAWDKDGHEAIGMTTMSALETKAVAHVKRLMHGKDAVDVAGWALKVNQKFPWTEELNFQAQPVREPGAKCKGANLTVCPDNRCLLRAIKHFYGRLVNKPEVDIDWGTGVKLTDADCVKYLISLIGDLHQPLHFGCQADNMGRNLTVMFRGKKSSLFDFWDKEITQHVIKESPQFWWGGWTHVQRTRVEYEKDGAAFKTDGAALFNTWADETARYTCESIYKSPTHGRPLMDDMVGGVYKVDEGLYEMWKREMLSKMLVAGARTAIVLNSILQHKELGSLHGGTAVSDLEGEEDEDTNVHQAELKRHKGLQGDVHHQAHGTKAMRGPQAAMFNLVISAITFTLFVMVMQLWHSMDGVNKANKAKAEAPDAGKSV